MKNIMFFQLLSLLLLHQIPHRDAAISTSFPISGLFSKESQITSKQAFSAMMQQGENKPIHGRAIDSEADDSYSTALEVCELTSENKSVVALIDTRSTNGICDTVCLLCNSLNISHLSVGWEPIDTLAENLYTLSYYPPHDLISKAYSRLIKDLQWDKFTFLYEDDSSFIRLQDVINTWPKERDPIVFRKLDPEGDNKEIFKHILKVARISFHILDCDISHVYKYFNEIVEIENSTEYLSIILTNLDSFHLDLKNSVPELMANVSTMHLTTTSNDMWTDIGVYASSADDSIRLETALVVDALYHIEKAIRKMQSVDSETYITPRLVNPPPLCYQENQADYKPLAWPSGKDLLQALSETTLKGFTGNIEFDDEGRRKNIALHYSKLNSTSQFNYVGDWNSNTDFITKEYEISDRSTAKKSISKTRIGVVTVKPYIYHDANATVQFRGYAVDLIDKIFELIKIKQGVEFAYEFYVVGDNKLGNPIAGTNKWNGLMGDLIEHKADLGICDLTITSERNAVVDFSVPFMSLGISMLFKEPDPVDPDMFSFIQPLGVDVWLYLATTYIIVSFILLICARENGSPIFALDVLQMCYNQQILRMSQDDWVNPHPCNQNPESLQNIWSLYNCMWLTMGAIMTQGCDILPRGAGSRWTAGMWWFFALIITASYTANMSTFLSNNRRTNDIADVKALSEQNKVSYGAVVNASTYNFFKSSNESVYKKIWAVMNSAKPTVFTANNDEGVDRVLRSKNGNYAFFMESTAIEYYKQRHCELKMVGPLLDAKEYGIAMPKNYPYKAWIDSAILNLQERGHLTALQKKWWEEEDNEAHCERRPKEEDDGGSLQMKNTSGIFLVLGFGGILGLIVAIVDFILHARQISVKEKVTFKEAFISEWRASLNPRALHKPAAPPRSAPPSTGSPSPIRERSQSRAVSVLRAATSFINFDEIY